MTLLMVRWTFGLLMLVIASFFAGQTGDTSTTLTIVGVLCVLIIPTPLEVKRWLK